MHNKNITYPVFKSLDHIQKLNVNQDAFLSHSLCRKLGIIDRCPLDFGICIRIILQTQCGNHQLVCAVLGVTINDDAIFSVLVPSKITF